MEEKQLWRAYIEVPSDQNHIALTNLYEPLIQRIYKQLVRKYAPSASLCFSSDDIESEVRRGVALAIRSYDHKLGAFKPYVERSADWAVRDYVRQFSKIKRGQANTGYRLQETPIDRFENILSSKGQEDSQSTVDFWKKVHYCCRKKWKARLVMNLMYRECWSLDECAKYFCVHRNTVMDWHRTALNFLAKSKSLKQWLSDEPKKSGPRKYELAETFYIRCKGKTCVTEGCNGKACIRGRCQGCYYKINRRELIADEIYCSRKNCENAPYCRGLCQGHYQQAHRRGAFLPDDSPRCSCGNKMLPDAKACSVCIHNEKVCAHKKVHRHDPEYRQKLLASHRKYNKGKRRLLVMTEEQRQKSNATKLKWYYRHKAKIALKRSIVGKLERARKRATIILPTGAQELSAVAG